MDDLRYLAEYDPECFEKTCANVVYNIPETKSIMESAPSDSLKEEPKPSDRQNIEKILEKLKSMENNDFHITNIDTDKVKNLPGNLYMELLFPHNDEYSFMDVSDDGKTSLFDKKV